MEPTSKVPPRTAQPSDKRREAAVNPLTPTKSRYEKVGSLTRQGEATFLYLDAGREMEPTYFRIS